MTTGYLNIGNAGVGVFNHSGGTLLGSSWTGVATSAGGRGTYNISGTALYDRGNLEVAPRSGSDGVVNISGNADLRVNQVLFDHHAGAAARAELNLDGGNLSVNRIRIEDDVGGGASTFNWGSGTLRRKATITGAQGGFAVNGPGGEDPQRGATGMCTRMETMPLPVCRPVRALTLVEEEAPYSIWVVSLSIMVRVLEC